MIPSLLLLAKYEVIVWQSAGFFLLLMVKEVPYTKQLFLNRATWHWVYKLKNSYTAAISMFQQMF